MSLRDASDGRGSEDYATRGAGDRGVGVADGACRAGRLKGTARPVSRRGPLAEAEVAPAAAHRRGGGIRSGIESKREKARDAGFGVRGVKLLVGVDEAAAMLSCSERFVWRLISEKKLGRVKIAGLTRVRVSELKRLVGE